MAGELPPGYQQQFNALVNSYHNAALGGGTGSSAGQNSQGTSDSYQKSGSYFANPGIAGNVAGALGGAITGSAQGYNQFVNDPTSHPAYTNALAGMLEALHPGEQAGRRDLADMYRAAGNTASSSYGEAMNKYQQGVDRNRMGVASDLLAKLYPQIAGAMFAPMSQAPELLGGLKLDQSIMQSHQQNTSTPAKGTPGLGMSSMTGLGADTSGGLNFGNIPSGTGAGVFGQTAIASPSSQFKRMAGF
jgi:hypothetical protein